MRMLVVFDFDGTLVDSKKEIFDIVNSLAQKYHRPKLSMDEFETNVSNLNILLLFRYRIWPWEVFRYIKEGRAMFKAKVKDLRLFPQAKKVLSALHSKYKFGILTHNRRENVLELFKREGIDSFFDFIFETRRIRGKVRELRKIIKESKFDRKNIIYVGDEVADVQACKQVGIKVIAVSWGFSKKKDLQKAKPDYLVNSFNEIESVILSIDGKKTIH